MRDGMERAFLLSSAAAAVIAGLGAAPASAEMYGSVFGGLNLADSMRISSTNFPYGDNLRTLNWGPGGVFGIAAGSQFGMIRGEAELSYRWNSLGNVTVQGEGNFAGTGNVGVFALMANGWFDTSIGMGVAPYFGGGVGVANVHVAVNTAPTCCTDPLNFSNNALTFAFQLGAGVRLGIGGGNRLSLDYRYFQTADFTIPNLRGDGYGTGSTHYSAHSFMLGLTMPLGPGLRFP